MKAFQQIWRREKHILCNRYLKERHWLPTVRAVSTRYARKLLTLHIGSDPVGAALCFYKGLKAYPEPKSLIGIYENTVPKDVQEILAIMVSQDRNLNVGSFGASSEKSGSESGHGVE